MKNPRLGQLIAEVKAREFEGWSFDRAEASFELLVKRVLKQVPAVKALLSSLLRLNEGPVRSRRGVL